MPQQAQEQLYQSDLAQLAFNFNLPTSPILETLPALANNQEKLPTMFLKEYTPLYGVKLVRTGDIPTHERPIVRSPSSVVELVRDLLKDQDRETMLSVLLDTKGRVIGINLVGIGYLDALPIHPRELFKAAILASAATIILVHNHPAGDPIPSQADIFVTQKLAQAGDLLRIGVSDHIIIGDENWVSLKQLGYF